VFCNFDKRELNISCIDNDFTRKTVNNNFVNSSTEKHTKDATNAKTSIVGGSHTYVHTRRHLFKEQLAPLKAKAATRVW